MKKKMSKNNTQSARSAHSAWPAFQHDHSAGMASDRVSLGVGVLVH